MSLFRTVLAECPSCKAPNSFELVHSVNADRRPDLRDEILERRFQEQACTGCGNVFRLEPEFSYVHNGGGLWLGVWPASKLDQWADCEARSRKAFDGFFGEAASAAAQAIGRELKPRVAFGWEGAHEKLVVMAAGIDDVTLELAKISLLRAVDGLGPMDDRELRLLGVGEDGNMVFGLFDTGSEALQDTLFVPRTLLDEIEADAEGWKALRNGFSGALFVDVARLTLAARAV